MKNVIIKRHKQVETYFHSILLAVKYRLGYDVELNTRGEGITVLFDDEPSENEIVILDDIFEATERYRKDDGLYKYIKGNKTSGDSDLSLSDRFANHLASDGQIGVEKADVETDDISFNRHCEEHGVSGSEARYCVHVPENVSEEAIEKTSVCYGYILE